MMRGITRMFWRKTGRLKVLQYSGRAYRQGVVPIKCSVRNHRRPRVKKVMEARNLSVSRNIFNIIISLTSTFKRPLNWVLRDLIACFLLFFRFSRHFSFLLGLFLLHDDCVHFLVMFLILSCTKLMQPTVS